MRLDARLSLRGLAGRLLRQPSRPQTMHLSSAVGDRRRLEILHTCQCISLSPGQFVTYPYGKPIAGRDLTSSDQLLGS